MPISAKTTDSLAQLVQLLKFLTQAKTASDTASNALAADGAFGLVAQLQSISNQLTQQIADTQAASQALQDAIAQNP